MAPLADDLHDEFNSKAQELLQPLLLRYDDVTTAALLADLAEHLEVLAHDFVRSARTGGRTWDEIGAAFGISRQGAHNRFGR